jgi:hypothetical protein
MGPRAGVDDVAKTEDACPCRETNPGRPSRSLVTILTELSWLRVLLSKTLYSEPNLVSRIDSHELCAPYYLFGNEMS